ncbi:DUF4231 domain-containing protein [Mesomycoplasma ovipneumoniae]|uniref:DUF4231 domain-containing protein n=1 Tax=Mesomycoplasma ovipneumoniae TaxID=29562 RepID=A0AAP6CV75_9BACT|nr:DUF4231 domain-containing protein [Mesomycoplasma ovipneumoniae]MCP9306340.1 DUF4231 domain-containing protein [Mesomycoplasma ovipneumoniae]MDW2834461.1 DUF4231 domain-containing protein [Mesomycoplasma ovipneumoniae]MDW2852644.1 DUF4231 domain-containing protein [Mesomycoplasma ovipneumoniae]MDW2861247.1 DUF4231 domain-containing protein [Mesomycoplasma ovipneumoniae]WNM13698.1 DUF4231 domain-containing protein [Mesomycoplasma ovipneumoniae]
MNKEKLLSKIELDVIKLTAKARVSKGIFLFCSIALILMSAFNGILSAYAITKNPNPTAVKLFVAIAFINAIISFVSSLSSFFVFENVYKKSTEKINFYEEKKNELLSQDANIDEIAKQLGNIKIEN